MQRAQQHMHGLLPQRHLARSLVSAATVDNNDLRWGRLQRLQRLQRGYNAASFIEHLQAAALQVACST